MHKDRIEALQAFVDALSEPALLIDDQRVIRAANRACARWLGVDLEALLGETALARLPPAFLAAHGSRIQTALAGQGVAFEERRNNRHLIQQLEPVIDAAGRVTGVAVFATDVTSFTPDRAAGPESGPSDRSIVDTCLEGVWQIDNEARTTFMNEQMATMLGYSVDECIGRKLSDFMDETAWTAAQHKLERRKQGMGERHEFRFRHKLGRDVWAVVSAVPVLGEQGDYVGALALVTDVTDARVLEQKIQHTQKLESLGVLAGGVAHDFNNVLAGILGNLELARNELGSEARASFFIKEAELAARRAADLTRQLLAYTGRGGSAVDVIDLNGAIHDVRSLLSTVVSTTAELHIELAPSLPPVRGDSGRLRQVILNLVMNASDALQGETGTISVVTSLVQASAADLCKCYLDDSLEPGPYVCVEVRDTGCGMSREVFGRIFEPFFSTNATGHGLGLAAVVGILRTHKAGIIVDTKPGRGTSFRILLPAVAGVEATPGPARSEPAERRRLRVLVADDEDAVRNVTVKTLERLGYQCVPCSNGVEALALLSEAEVEVDLLLLDMTMPELGGDEVLLELRRRGTTTPVILMSGFGALDTSPELMSAGAADFIEKPFGPGELSRRIQAVIGPAK